MGITLRCGAKSATLFALLLTVACSSNSAKESSNVTSGTSGAGSITSSSSGSNGTAGSVSLNISQASAGGTGVDNALPDGEVCGTMCPAGQATCAVEACDGIDNNCDGNIDNIDKNADGICDCLLIATLGNVGTSGQGDVFSTWLAARSNNGATSLGDQVLTPDLLAKYQIIVAQDVHLNHAYSAAEVQALQAWVNNGGGFMTLIGYSLDVTEVVNVNALVQPFGMNYGNMHILPKVGGTTTAITQWVPHPVDLGVTAVGVDNGYEVQGAGTVFATGGGYNVGAALGVSKGHVLMWGDEWITYNSEWTQHTDYQVQLFWLNIIKWLTVAGTCEIPIPVSLGGPIK